LSGNGCRRTSLNLSDELGVCQGLEGDLS
jgi:hypothetical protein